jgi:hypothetical protein
MTVPTRRGARHEKASIGIPPHVEAGTRDGRYGAEALAMTTQDWWDAGIWIGLVLGMAALAYLIVKTT